MPLVSISEVNMNKQSAHRSLWRNREYLLLWLGEQGFQEEEVAC
jgi:hypothetical protein